MSDHSQRIIFDPEDYDKAIEYFEKAGDTAAKDLYDIGSKFYNGDGVNRDLETAFRCFFDSAERGNPAGMYCTGSCFLYGEGVQLDLSKALEYLQKSADKDYLKAADLLGRMYYYGLNVKTDYEIAFKYLLSASEEFPECMYCLGECYENGLGTERD